MMFFGVMIFSYVMGVYGEILTKFNKIEEEFDDGNKLMLWFDVLKHFNGREGLKKTLKDEIEDYFNYRWTNHPTLPI